MCANVRLWDLDFRPLAVPPDIASVGRIVQSRLGPLELGHARLAVRLDQYGSPPPGRVTFVILEADMQRLWWRGHDVGNDTVLAFPVGSELESLSDSRFEVHTVSVEEETISEICDALQIEYLPAQHRREVFHLPVEPLNRLRQELRLIRDGKHLPSAFEVRALLQTLVGAWFASPGDPAGSSPAPRNRDKAVLKCLDLMEDADWLELSPERLREHAGVSERTLQYAFQERFGLTPAAFLKARRLAAVRSELLHARPAGASVSQVVAQFGFWHSGQFAADYRRAFGELPSETLKRDRALNA